MMERINDVYAQKYQPFIKWVGGKRGLLKPIPLPKINHQATMSGG